MINTRHFKTRYYGMWEPRIGARAASLNWKVYLWQARLVHSLYIAAVPLVIARIAGWTVIAVVILIAWMLCAATCIAMMPSARQRAKAAIADYIGWDGKPEFVPRDSPFAFDRWLETARKNDRVHPKIDDPASGS